MLTQPRPRLRRPQIPGNLRLLRRPWGRAVAAVTARWVRLIGLLSPSAGDLVAVGALAVVVLVSFREAIAGGMIAFQNDTEVFFYPLAAWFASELRSGLFPLWNPYIFGGYPIFADGEIGLAYPLHLALLYALPMAQAFVWLRVSSVLIAAVGTYLLCRALGLRRLPSIVGALTFGLGSFFLHQQHHENITRTAAWLPLLLAATEAGLRRAGWARQGFLTAAAVALAMAALGLHPQVLAMVLLAFATYVVFRVVLGPVGRASGGTTNPQSAIRNPQSEGAPSPQPSPPSKGRGEDPGALRHGGRRSAACLARHTLASAGLIVWVGCYVGGLGLALAAVQLLPLAEMGAATYRGSQPDYLYATSYALPMHNLITLVFPYFFRGPESEYWSLWANWETTPYVGIIPLILAIAGAVLARRREALYFVLLGAVAAWLAFASYAPFDLYGLMWGLPGFSAFRVPGRYTLLVVFALAVLAAFGLHALTEHAASRKGLRMAATAGLFGGLAVAAAALVIAMLNLRSSLVADPAGAMAWLESTYLSLRHHEAGIEVADVYHGLLHSLDLDTPRTAFALGLVGLGLALALGATLARRASAVWQLALAAVVTLDLLAFGMSFHRKTSVDQVIQITPGIEFLASVASTRQGADLLGNWRVFTPGTIPSLEFNRLVPFRIEDIGGYSSLESRRSFAYWATIQSIENELLDLANVRYIVDTARPRALPSYRQVPFDPERPLMLGARDSIGGLESYSLGFEPGDRIQMVAALTRAIDIPQGDIVAQVTVVPDEGEPVVIHARAGLQVGEWAYDRSDIAGRVRHEQPAEIAFRRPDVFLLDGSRYDLYFYYSEYDLPRYMRVDRIELRYLHPLGGIEVYGLGLYNFETGETAGVTQRMRTKLRRIYRDDEIMVIENLASFPRAYVVPSARVAPDGYNALSAMLDTRFDPAREVMLEPGELPISLAAGGSSNPQARGLAPAEALLAETDRVAYRATAPDGGYFVHVANFFPGWRATVDGQETEVLQANSLFRAVPLPPGEHVVELRYEPYAVALGIRVTAAAGLVALATLTLGVIAQLSNRARQRRRAERLARWQAAQEVSC